MRICAVVWATTKVLRSAGTCVSALAAGKANPFTLHVGIRAARVEATADIQRLSRQVEDERDNKHAVLVVLKAGYRVAHLVHRGPVREQRQIARSIHGIRLVLRVTYIIHRPVVAEVATLLLVGDASAEGVEVEVVGSGQLGKLRSRHLSSNDASRVVVGIPHHCHARVNGRGRQGEAQRVVTRLVRKREGVIVLEVHGQVRLRLQPLHEHSLVRIAHGHCVDGRVNVGCRVGEICSSIAITIGSEVGTDGNRILLWHEHGGGGKRQSYRDGSCEARGNVPRRALGEDPNQRLKDN